MTDLDTIKQIPIEDYAARCGFTPVRKGNRYISLAEHDSVMIDTQKNRFWRNSRLHVDDHASGSILDFAMEFMGYPDISAAVRGITEIYGNEKTKFTGSPKHTAVSVKQEFLLPKRANGNYTVIKYLHEKRCIDRAVIAYFIRNGMLYQDDRANCVFVSRSGNFACKRGTGETRFVQDVSGSDYTECFYFRGSDTADTVVVAESVIDLMSVMTVKLRNREQYTDFCYLALSGVSKMPALYKRLDTDTRLRKIVFALDRDDAGQKATEDAAAVLRKRGYTDISVSVPPFGKDWNDAVRKLYPFRETRCLS